MCVCGCVLHIQACYKRTQRVRITQELASRRLVLYLKGHRLFSHTSMLRLEEQLTGYPTINKKHQKPWEFFRSRASVTDRKQRGSKGGRMEENKEEWAAIHALLTTLTSPLPSLPSTKRNPSMSGQNTSSSGPSFLKASFFVKYLCVKQTNLFLTDVRGFRGEGRKDVVALKASTFVLTALVCLWQCWFWVLSLFNRAVVCLDKSIQSCFWVFWGEFKPNSNLKFCPTRSQLLERTSESSHKSSVCRVKTWDLNIFAFKTQASLIS